MSEQNVWIAFTKARPLDGCDIDFDGGEFLFVDIYLPIDAPSDVESDMVKITDKVKNALARKQLELADITLLARFQEGVWEVNTDNLNDVNELAAKAMESGDIVFSGFRSEEIEALQTYHHSIMDSAQE